MTVIPFAPRLLALAFVLAACSAPRDANPPPTALGGLTAQQADDLRALGVPVLVPGDPGAFRLTGLAAERTGSTARWAVDYQRDDGVCFEVSGGNDGFGGPDMPLVSTEASIRDLGRRVRVYQAADVPGATSAQVWGLRTVVSDFIDLDGAAALLLSDTEGGCTPVSLDEGARIVSGLVRLTGAPASDADRAGPEPRPSDAVPDRATLGAFAPADDVLERANAASSPDVAAEVVARRYADDAGQVTVDVLTESSYEATALVTLLDLRDDSVRDERLLLTYTPVGGTWELIDAGRQVRCQPGRGHQTWSAAACD